MRGEEKILLGVCLSEGISFYNQELAMLILAEKAFRQPGVTMKSSFYLKLLSKAARVTTAEHTPVFLVNIVSSLQLPGGYNVVTDQHCKNGPCLSASRK